MQIQPYILYGRTGLQNVKDAAQRLLQDWIDAWDLAHAALSLSAAGPVSELTASEGTEPVLLHAAESEKWLLFFHNKELVESMGSLLLHDSRVRPRQGSIEDGLVADVVTQALADLAARLSGNRAAGSLAGSTLRQFVSPAMQMPGTGILCLRIDSTDFAISIWISAGIARSLAAGAAAGEIQEDRPQSLTPAGKALGGQRVPVQVILGNAELTLDALCSLRVGDVIRLDENLSEPLLVAFAQSGIGCKGFLGQQNGNLAVQLDALANA